MLSWDETYINAKEILEGKRILEQEIQLLKNFIDKEFGVELINADVYNQPVFKNLPTSLRLIVDFTTIDKKLPVKYEEKKTIGNAFIKLLREKKMDKYSELKIGELDVKYVDIGYLRFEEALRNMTSDIKVFDSDISRVLRGGYTYFILYPNNETLIKKKENGQAQNILATLIDLIQKKGYKGKYIEKIQVILDEISTIERVGGTYNYLR